MRKLFISVLCACLSLWSCARQKPAYVFPQSLATNWNLQSQQPFQPSSAPESIRSLTIPKAWTAKYSNGPRSAMITAYETAADAVAFEASQKWRHDKGQMAVNEGSYFVVVESLGSDLAELETITKAMEASLKSWSK